MANLNEYIKWRGELSFSEAPLNEVDNLIFSMLSYIDLRSIIPEELTPVSIPLKAAANGFFNRNPDLKKVSMGLIIPKDILKLLHAIKETRRFQSVELCGHVNQIDTETEMQFSATTFLLDSGTVLVAYRGTDDTLVGWKEDFNMSFMPVVPAQRAALEYLRKVAKAFPKRPLAVTGHSKGGNLAVYAAAKLETKLQDRILTVQSNDGPGFGSDLLKTDSYMRVRSRVKTFVPQGAVIGMLLEHEENYTVIKSRHIGLFQHDALSWDVMGSSLVRAPELNRDSKRNDRVLNDWIRQMTPEQREEFSESLYRILSADSAMTLTELASAKNKWIRKSRELDPMVYKTVLKTISLLIRNNTKTIFSDLISKKKK